MGRDKKIKVLVLKPFQDKYILNKHYEPGDKLSVDADRAADLEERGRASIVIVKVIEDDKAIAKGVEE